ncbi:MAG: hypothetical protein GY719_17775 [bacterium]|nr:hypothetical protein [bacterium]
MVGLFVAALALAAGLAFSGEPVGVLEAPPEPEAPVVDAEEPQPPAAEPRSVPPDWVARG